VQEVLNLRYPVNNYLWVHVLSITERYSTQYEANNTI
jgi:hypothetical protein